MIFIEIKADVLISYYADNAYNQFSHVTAKIWLC